MLLSRAAFVLVIAAAATAHADSVYELGGTLGATSSRTLRMDADGSESEPHNAEYGGAYGVYGHYLLTRAVLFEGSLMYTQKGASHTTFYYAEMPVLLRVDVARPWSSARVFANAGFAAAVRVACTHSEIPFGFDVNPCADDRTPSRFDFDLALGGGLGSRDFEVQVRYERGLIDIGGGSGSTINRTLFVLFGIHRTIAL